MGFFINTGTDPRVYLKRTIYPVGQGAFYAEHFEATDVTTNIVYDCGGNSKAIDNQIQTFCNGTRPDIKALIVSHFHSDHINGINKLIKNCEVCNIFIPYVSPQVFMLDFLLNISVDRNEQPSNEFLLKFALPVLNKKERETIQCVNVFPVNTEYRQLCKTDDLWSYCLYYPSITPDNYRSVDRFISEICQTFHISDAASRNYLAVHEYETIAGLFKAEEALNKLKEIFKKHFNGDQNIYSLLMASKPTAETTMLKDEDKHFSSCLYTGDCPMSDNAVAIVQSIEPAIIQVPHHGSKNNFLARLYNAEQYSFVSAGSDNKYGHPDGITIGTINNICKKCFLVTELDSALTHTYEMVSQSKNILSNINITQ